MPLEKGEAVRYLVEEYSLSVPKSCCCVRLSRAAFYVEPKRSTDKDRQVIDAQNREVEKHPRWGFWMCFKALRRKGHRWNHKRVYRVYCALTLNQKRRAKRRLPERVRQPLVNPTGPNQIWSADFMSDALYASGRFGTFNVIDDFNREVLAIEIDTSITARRLIRVFERSRRDRGLPAVLRVDNGPEFLNAAFVTWAEEVGMTIQYIQPGKPDQNAYIERFNRTYRNEVLDLYLFRTLAQVRETTHGWMIEDNEERPHDALEDLAPQEFMDEKAGNSTFRLST